MPSETSDSDRRLRRALALESSRNLWELVCDRVAVALEEFPEFEGEILMYDLSPDAIMSQLSSLDPYRALVEYSQVNPQVDLSNLRREDPYKVAQGAVVMFAQGADPPPPNPERPAGNSSLPPLPEKPSPPE